MHRRIILLGLLLALAACGEADIKGQLVGSWQNEAGTLTVTYTPAGEVYISGLKYVDCYTVSGDTVTIRSFKDRPPPATMAVAFTGADKLTTTNSDGSNPRVFRRLNSTGALDSKGQAAKDAQVFDAAYTPCAKP